MLINESLKLNEKFSILLHLPKKCSCHSCMSTKKEIRAEMGEREYRRVCQILKIN